MKPKQRKECICEQCANVFYRLASQMTRDGQGRFCSKECMEESRKRGNVYACERCGAAFYRRNGELRRNPKRVFCSRECYMATRRDEMKATTYAKQNAIHKHRIAAEHKVGRKLRRGEVVHHIDGNKHNNDASNLFVYASQADHARAHRQAVKNCAEAVNRKTQAEIPLLALDNPESA